MKNNKIYMTLAHLYNQIKGVVGDSDRSLSEEIDKRIVEHEEVVNARKGHNTLIDKIDAIDSSIDGTNFTMMDMSNRINETEDDIVDLNNEIDTIKATNPTVELENGNHLLVNMLSRPSHKSDMFSLNAEEQYRTNANSEHYVSQLYVRDNIHNKEIDMAFTADNSDFDSKINELRDGSLYSIFTGEMELPLSNMVIANQAYDNIASVPGLCDLQAIISAPYLNETNHAVSAFRHGYTWYVKAKMAEVIINFVHPIEITRMMFEFKANTLQQSVVLYKSVDEKWVEFSRVPSIDGKIEIREEIQKIKIGFHSLSEQDNTVLEISNIRAFSKKYGSASGIATVSEMVDLYDLSGYATLAPIIDIPEHTTCKFGIYHSDSVNECYAYYPNRRYLEAGLFVNTYHMPVVGKIKSSIRDSYTLEDRYVHKRPTGNDGDLILEPIAWKEDSAVSLSNGYQLDNLTYIKLYITPKSKEYEFILEPSSLNKITNLTIDGIDVSIEVKKVNGIKLAVQSSHTLASVRCEFNTLMNVFSAGDGSYTRPSSSSSVSATYNSSLMLYNIASRYSCSKNYYRWEQVNSWGGGWHWVSNGSSSSKYNQSLNESIIFIDCENVYSNICLEQTESHSGYKSTSFVLSNTNSCVAYIGTNSSASESFLNDGELIPIHDSRRVSMANEFTGKLKIDRKQKVVKIEPDQYADSIGDIEYFLSFNNYNFYTYTQETNAWVQTKKGMTAEDITRIPSYAFEKLFSSDDIYVKVRINTSTAYVNGLDIGFDIDKFNLISHDNLSEYGMNLSDIKNVSASFIMELINEFSTISIIMHSTPKLECWQYIVPGIQLIEYGGISWGLVSSDIATQHISGNMLIIKNVSNEIKYFKLEQKFFEDSIVVVGDKLQNEAFNTVTEEVDSLKDGVNTLQAKVDILDQNVQLLHDAFIDGTKPPQELPTFIIPSQIEVDLEPLSPGNSTEIKDIKNLRYIQFWDTQKHPIPEFVEHKAVKDLQHHFIYKNGVFTSDHFEMDKYYDTDNAYLMTQKITGTNNKYTFETDAYRCDIKRSDGPSQAPRSGNPSKILTGPQNYWSGNSYYSWGGWASSQDNLVYNLPGENARWIDFDFEFLQEEYIHGLFNMDFGGRSDSDSYMDRDSYNYSWQITTIFLDYDGSGNWVEHTRYLGMFVDKNLYIDKAVKKLRIRIEIPYTYNRGAGEVGFKYLDIYHCPIRYLHDVDATIMPILYYNTETWERLLSVYSDATITGTNTDIHYLFETNNVLQNDKRYWGFDGSKLVEKQEANYSNGMLLQQFNNITEKQLTPLLDWEYVRPIAILDSTDGHYTPYIKTLRMNYSEKSYETTSLVNPQDVNTRYDKDAQKVIVTNATQSNKTLKAIIS